MSRHAVFSILLSVFAIALAWELALGSAPTSADSSEAREIVLEELWRVGAGEDDDVIFGVVSSVAIDAEKNVYVLDRQLTEVSMFSGRGEYLGPVGREGEGPGEYHRIGHVFISGPGEIAVMQRLPGKIVCVNTDGTPGGSVALPDAFADSPTYFFNGQLAGADLVILGRRLQRDGDAVAVTTSLLRVDPSGEVVATLSENRQDRSLSALVSDEKSDAPVLWTVGADGQVYLNDEFDSYAIREYDPAGNHVRTLSREYEHRERDAEEMRENTPGMVIRSQDGDRRVAEGVPSPTDRDVQAIFARPDGSLWVLTSRGAFDRPSGVLATFDVFDAGGQFQGEIALEGEGNFRDDGFHLVGDRLVVTRGQRAALRVSRGDTGGEEDATPMFVICYSLS